MFNPLDHRSLDRLGIAISNSRWRLQPFRQNRLALMKHYVGAHYSWSGAPQKVPLNLINLAWNIYLRQLVSRAPRSLITARDTQLKSVAADMQAWMDKATVGMDLARSLRACVADGLTSMGVMKVGEAMVGEMDFFGTSVAVGQPFAEPVDLDDLVFDITAKRWDQVQFAGNRYRVPLDQAKANPYFDADARNRLQAMTKMMYNERGDLRTTTISQSTMQLYDEFQDHCELWDIWMPPGSASAKQGLILVMPYQDSIEGGFSGQRPLKIIEWDGPARGPFIPLSYADVGNNVMPAAPLQALVDMHELVNILWRKIARQGERQKSILGFMGSATDDAERINRSSDGDAVRIDFADKTREMSWGGIKSENMAAAIQSKELFTYMAGNLDALGGLSPQAQTLGQDELLTKNASAQVSEMQDRTINFTREVYRALAQHWWKNPVLTYEASRQVAGVDIPVEITPQMRQIPFEKLNFDIDPYSMTNQTPQGKLSAIMQTLTQLVMPALGMMQQQGVTLKWPALFALISKYGDLPELDDLLEVGPPPQQQPGIQTGQQAAQQASQQPPGMPSVTHRVNTRINRPGATSNGNAQIMSQLLSGSRGQPGQMASVGRGVG